MPESPRPVDLRLTIPAAAPYPELAGAVAAKFAEYVGASADVAERLAAQIRALAAKFPNGHEVTFTIEVVGRQVTVTAAAGERREHSTFPL